MENQEDEGRGPGDHHVKHDGEETLARQEENKKSIEAKIALRQSNLNPERPDTGFFRTLDSSIKRNTAVIKKLKQINEEQREGLLEELKSVNLSKFVSEAVTSICDAKLRTSDINAAVQICSLLHQRYKDFSPSLVQGLLRVFFPGKSGDDVDADKNMKAIKKRSTLKLLMELFFVGVVDDASIFVTVIKDLTSLEQLKDKDTTQMNMSLVASFVRQGRSFLGLSQSGQEEEFFNGLNITTDQKKLFKKAIYSYYEASTDNLQSEHASLRQMELENAKVLNAKGELSDENVNAYEKLRKSFDHLFRGVSSLAEALDMQPPVMPEDGHTRVTTGEDIHYPSSGKDVSAVEPIWDDEDTRAFYECLPDLRAFVPAVLLGESEPKTAERPTKDATSEGDHVDVGEVPADSESSPDGKSSEKGKSKEDSDKEKMKDLDKGKDKEAERKGELEKEKPKAHDGPNLDGLLQRLPGCVSRDLIDQLTVEFCYLNSKSSRKKLVRAFYNVPRTSLELLPYYSRMVATLSTCMKDISSTLLQMLEEEFNFLINKKDQMNIETKIRNIRFIGELCKFKIAPPGLVFTCFKACLDDFTHHNIDVACNLLETCGSFLYRSPETTIRMANMLEILMRLKNVKNLDSRHSTLVENAYYLCKPPEKSARISKVRPPLHQYIRKLLFSDLDKNMIEYVLRQLRKLPWSDCEPYILKCFLKVHKGKYSQVHLIASLTAGLSRYHEGFAVAVVDELLEEIRLGLELNDYGMQQKRLAHTRFLGELYNYEIVESSVIFETLYMILVFGHYTPEQDILDPPEDCFRIRMIVMLLQTCGHYFDRGSSRRKLDRFLIYFQRYILSKGPLPLDIEFDIQDLFSELRPNITRYSSAEEMNTALIELEEHERNVATEKGTHEKGIKSESYKTSAQITAMSSASDAQQSALNGIEENGGLHGDIEYNTDSESDSIDVEGGHEDDELLYEDKSDPHDDGCDSEDDDVGGPIVSDEEEDVLVRQKIVEVDPLEEADFDREFKALMQESLDSRKLELRGRPTLNMMIPMNVFEGSRDHGRALEGESGDETLDEDGGGSNRVLVNVIVRKGNKQRTKQMFIPSDCSLVQSTKEKEAAELEEKQNIKRLVLEYNDREEEYNGGTGTQPINWAHVGGSRPPGRMSWDGSGRTVTRPRHHSSGGLYGRRR